jgi:ATP-dependent helicase/nuclease subunit A
VNAATPREEAARRQRAAADPEASVWVSASAGTGKTKVLTDRVLALLVTGTDPHRILCLTFTRAAAAEMANRVNRALGDWATMTDAALETALAMLLGRAPDAAMLRRARTLFARVLDTPGGMKIQTIHAFCESLLGRFPLEAGLAPHFQLMDERGAAEALAFARDALLARARLGEDDVLAAALAEVTARVNEEEFAAILGKLSAERGRIGALTIGADGTERTVARIYERLGVKQDETDGTILAAACADAAFDGVALRRCVEAMLKGSKRDVDRGGKLAGWLAGDVAFRVAAYRDYRSVFFTTAGSVRKDLMYKDAIAVCPDGPDVMATEAGRVDAVEMRLRALVTARASAALIRLGRGLLDAYEAHKRAHGLLDYDDLIHAARALLLRDGGASWVMYKLDEGIDHILIDEAQDTNPEQWDVVRALAEEFFAGEGAREGVRTVFAVGDRKQSIYSFQRADPAAFEAMRAHFQACAREAGRRWEDVDLHISFRSTPSVLAAVDAVFALDAARDGVAAKGEIVEHVPDRAGQAGVVELWPTVAPDEREDAAPWTPPVARQKGEAPDAALAAALAGLIQRWIGAERLASRARAVRPGDIMVLVRQRGGFVERMVRALKLRGVPVAGVDRMVLTDQLAVQDLVALGRFLLLPEDDLTLATVLKGPLVGLGEEALFDLAWPRGEGEPLWHALRDRAAGDEAFDAAYRFLSAFMARADFVPPYELYAEVLSARGGRRMILSRLGPDAADPIDEFMAGTLEFERTHAPSLQGFLAWLERGEVEIKRDLEQATRDEVRVMTVHGSKGLQAPIVFLPDTTRVPTRGDELLWTADGLMLWPPRAAHREHVAEAARAAAAQAREQEYRRLLYVAMTRAEDRLYVCGWRGRNNPSEGNWHQLVTDGLAARKDAESATAPVGPEAEAIRLANPQERPPEIQDAARGFRPEAVIPPGWVHRPAPTEEVPPRPLSPSRSDEAEPPTRSPLGDDRGAAFRRGILIHRLLQTLPDLPAETRRRAAADYLARPTHGLDEAAQAEIASAVLAVLDDTGFAALFGPGSRAEVPVAGRIGDRVISGQLDRLVVAGGEVRIVDYKSNRPAPVAADSVPPLYLRQMAAYRAVVSKVYPYSTVTCAILWTDGPVLMLLPPALLDIHAP